MAGSLLADISRLGVDNEFADVTLFASDGHSRRANCAILAARSEVFHRMLMSPMLEGQAAASGQREIHLKDISADVLDAILRWCYCDRVVEGISLSMAVATLVAADYLQMAGLLSKCAQLVSRLLTEDNIDMVVAVAEATGSAELKRRLAVFMAKGEAVLDIQAVPAHLQCMVSEERAGVLRRRVAHLKETEHQVPAGRPPIVFWRQGLPMEAQRHLIMEALEGGDPAVVLPALCSGLRDGAVACFRELLEQQWAALDEDARRPFIDLAEEDELRAARARLDVLRRKEAVKAELESLCTCPG